MGAEFTANRNSPSNCKTGYIIVGVYGKKDFTSSAAEADEKSGGVLKNVVSNDDLGKKPGECVLVPAIGGIKAKRVLIVQLGKREEFDSKIFLKAVQGAAECLSKLAADSVAFCLDDMELQDRDLAWQSRHVVQSINFCLYKFTQLKTKDTERTKKWRIQFISKKQVNIKPIRAGIRVGAAISNGVSAARELGNLPGNICTPTYLANKARELAGHDKIDVEVLEEKDMQELGMGSLLSVSRGSREPAKLILIQYRGGPEKMRPVALVGKGLTFDAGGISIKPAGSMDEMKFDMCGAAGVIGAITALSELNLPMNVVGVIPSSENLPDGAANKPGDIVTSMAGTTIEVLNTDAEGRLILCDALTYTERFNPTIVIDAATLTGACVIALGKHPSGMFSNDDKLAEDLIRAGETSCDRVWRMPLWEDYNAQLKSNFADLANIGGRDAGAVTAACFLAHFTKNFKWAHLDIAGTAWNTGSEKGATGRPVGTFTQYLIDYCENLNNTSGTST